MKLKNSLTTTLIVVISGFFVIANYAPTITWGGLGLQEHLLLVNNVVFNDGQVHGVFAGEWWRVLTVVLTHANWLHLGSNMLVLFQFGNLAERFYGQARYVFVLIVSAVSASFLFLWLAPVYQSSVGASGMIFGLFGVALVSGKRMGIDYRQILGLVVINLIITFSLRGIAWQAHLGGLAGGIVAALILQALPQRRVRNSWE